MVKLESVELESHFFNVEKSIRSFNNETNTNAGTSHEENITNSAKVVSLYFYLDKLCHFYRKKCQNMQKYNITFCNYIISFSAVIFVNIIIRLCGSKGDESMESECKVKVNNNQ